MAMSGLFVWLLLLVVSDHVHAFRPHLKPAGSIPLRCMRSDGNIKDNLARNRFNIGYNDDCFGLVFLSGLLVAKDYLFCSTFAALSFVAAQIKNTGNKEQQQNLSDMRKADLYLIPSAVCLNAYVSSSVISSIYHDELLKISPALDTPPTWKSPILTSVTFISLMYGLFMSRRGNDAQ